MELNYKEHHPMKSLNKQIFLSYPVALLAAVVGMKHDASDSDYKLEAKRVADYFNNLENDSPAVVRDFPALTLFSRQELRMVLAYVRRLLGRITSFVAAKVAGGKSCYSLKCNRGSFKMILETNTEKKITLIEVNKEGL